MQASACHYYESISNLLSPSTLRGTAWIVCTLIVLIGVATLPLHATDTDAWNAVQAAQAYRAAGEPVEPTPDGTYFCEAEEFQVTSPGWTAQPWGENYSASTWGISFLSRKAFLGAPAQANNTVATLNVNIKQAGSYRVLARYEACYRFETRFRVKIEQGGTLVFNRQYGALSNTKIWAYGQKLQKQVVWAWGATDNIVWEGHNTSVALQPGVATITLTAGTQPTPAAKRNVDVLMLTTDTAQVTNRINNEWALPLDGWLTQADDVWLRATNLGPTTATVTNLPFREHSPYQLHMRNWSQVSMNVPAGQTSSWIAVGGTMDSLNDGQWGFTTSAACKLEIGVKKADGTIEKIREFASVNGTLNLIGSANMRYTRTLRTPQEGIDDLMAYLNGLPAHGKTPSQTMIFAFSNLAAQFDPLFGTNGYYMPQPKLSADLRDLTAEQLTAWCQALTPEQRANYLFINMGDEISTGAGMKPLTDILRSYLPNAGIGANYAPSNNTPRYTDLGAVNKWVTVFRNDELTMPWCEDYQWVFQMGTPQMNGINLDLFRAGLRHHPDRKIMYYVMPNQPGNIPNMWKRMFYNAMGHGTKLFNLYMFEPVWLSYTENHVTGNDMYGMIFNTVRDLGMYEDIVQGGQVRPSKVGLWFSETADTNNDYDNSGGAAKRTLYVTIRNQHLPLDFLVEADALDNTLDQYNVLYLTDRHVSQTASAKIAAWVQNGGRLFATAGAGMYDENNQPNTILSALMGVSETAFQAPPEALVGYEKQDLPFVDLLDQVSYLVGAQTVTSPAFGAISKFTVGNDVTILGHFGDLSPAVARRVVGQGQTIYCGFLPGLSYFKPAIPQQPVDRSSSADAMAHLLPTAFDANIGALVGSIAPAALRTVDTGLPYVESTVIEAPTGTIIPLTNWSNTPATGLQVTASLPLPTRHVSLVSGNPVQMQQAGGSTIFTLDLAVADTLILRGQPNTVNAGLDQTAPKGTQLTFGGSFTDPETHTHTIVWDFGDGGTVTDTLTPTHTFATPGVYTVTLTVTADDGFSASDTLTVTTTNFTGKLQPDLMIRTSAESVYTGNDIYSGSGDGQTKALSVPFNTLATYIFKIQNDGSTTECFTITGTGGGAGWMARYFAPGGVELTSQMTGAGWTTPLLAPGAATTFWVSTWFGNTIDGGAAKTLTVTATSTLNTAKKEVVKAVTTPVTVRKPDALVRAAADAVFLGNDSYNLTGYKQTRSVTTALGTTTTYYFKAQNDGNSVDSFVLTAPAASSGWTVKYYATGQGEITSQVTGAGWNTGVLARNGTTQIWATVKPESSVTPSNATCTLALTQTSTSDPTKQDLVKAITTAIIYQPDVWIRTSSEGAYTGNDVYSLDGTGESKAQTVAMNTAATYLFVAQNDGSTADTFTIAGTAGGEGWTVKYYASGMGEVTATVTGAGWSTGMLAPGTTKSLWVTVTSSSLAPVSSTKTLLITATSAANTSKKDVIKAETMRSP